MPIVGLIMIVFGVIGQAGCLVGAVNESAGIAPESWTYFLLMFIGGIVIRQLERIQKKMENQATLTALAGTRKSSDPDDRPRKRR